MNYEQAIEQMVMRNEKIKLSDWQGYWFMDWASVEGIAPKPQDGVEKHFRVFTANGDILDTPNIERYKDRDDWEITDGRMDFGFALRAMKSGKKVARKGWNGKGMWLQIHNGELPCETIEDLPEVDYKATMADKDGVITHIDSIPVALFDPIEGGNETILPCITMRTATGSYVRGWLASQTDMLATDWQIADLPALA